MKVWDRAGIELTTPGSAVRLASVARPVTDCATRPGSKIDKTKVLKTGDNSMQVKNTTVCLLGAFCNTFDLHLAIIGLENQFFVFF